MSNSGAGVKRPICYKRKRIRSSYSRVKRLHHAKESSSGMNESGLMDGNLGENSSSAESENNSDDDDDDLSTDSVRSGYVESNEDKEASGDERKLSSIRLVALISFNYRFQQPNKFKQMYEKVEKTRLFRSSFPSSSSPSP